MGLEGVRMLPLHQHVDERGSLLEAFRSAWVDHPVAQWNVQRSVAGSLRGVQVHTRRQDYFVLLTGRAVMGLRDLRPTSPTVGAVLRRELDGTSPMAVVIPPGVAHGWWFVDPSTHLIGFSAEWNTDDEHRIRWDDPCLGIEWPGTSPTLSAEDQHGRSLAEVVAALDLDAT